MACVFCGIVDGLEPAWVVWRDEEHVAFLDRSPLDEGHVLVVPRRHAVTLLDLAREEAAALGAASHRVARLLHERLHPHGLKVQQCNGRAAGQVVMHLHVHVIPRWAARRSPMGRRWTGRRAPEGVLAEVHARLTGP
ncbi:histidine triad (HIT) family protein [Streptoalloteichus hindustanus]|uniref:Histidine triad (HIT) family protein n=1 Tax=Streptoalloteichus hindustanus TaxID=2017 RepID=A0A1M4W2D7_STRHI|nr:histidine triad (HIT) family protein [Streptoalloteichus hindustanus]